MILYKVRNNKTGEFSTGGCYEEGSVSRKREPRPSGWSKKGKSWSGIGPLRTHLNRFLWIPDHWEVVEYEYALVKETVTPAAQVSNRAEKIRQREEKKQEEISAKQAALQKLTSREKELLGIR